MKRMIAILDVQNSIPDRKQRNVSTSNDTHNENQMHSNMSTISTSNTSTATHGNWSREKIYEAALFSNLKLWSRTVRNYA